MQRLAGEIGELDCIPVDDGQVSDAGSSQVLHHRRTQGAGPNHERAGRSESGLAGLPHPVEDQLPAVAFDLGVGQRHRPLRRLSLGGRG